MREFLVAFNASFTSTIEKGLVADVFADAFHLASRVEKEGPGKEIGILWLASCYESSDSYFKLP